MSVSLLPEPDILRRTFPHQISIDDNSRQLTITHANLRQLTPNTWQANALRSYIREVYYPDCGHHTKIRGLVPASPRNGVRTCSRKFTHVHGRTLTVYV